MRRSSPEIGRPVAGIPVVDQTRVLAGRFAIPTPRRGRRSEVAGSHDEHRYSEAKIAALRRDGVIDRLTVRP